VSGRFTLAGIPITKERGGIIVPGEINEPAATVHVAGSYAFGDSPMNWTITGDPKSCAEQLSAYAAAGLGHMALRLSSWDQRGQLTRFLEEVMPAYGGRG